MYFLYADESGDVGMSGSPCRYFCLSGFVIHELSWHDTLENIINFRGRLRSQYGLKLREEIHAAEFMHKPGNLSRIPKSVRLRILRDTIDFQAGLNGVSIINVLVDKSKRRADEDIFGIAWTTLIQRFHNTLSKKNFPGPKNSTDYGLLVVDRTEEVKLRALSRRMRRYNPVPKAFGTGAFAIPISTLVEDSVHRDSAHSYFIQLADVNAYFLKQRYDACKYVKKKGAKNYFSRLGSALCTVACNKHPEGIVER
ncbi:DUF3800 domain-containing protein [Hahella sp. KA22]|uniref:DUF3800 domain-containing protein n=1 Tax=Hahella sp. KA22 TaxID=1628392 RepID=UPI000FDDCBA7|nr:DUF3800 domain-containing protein [Hahella sp. KA22]AZZ94668.1 DUF3800 domain-containing protein [Hahella sp. KA22]QAY58041.1 DUF3800 domain-containing protein [Hahella sp. KA22]